MSTIATPTSAEVVRRYKAYPEYKDSGLEWLGEVPAHWDVKRTKFAARLRSGHTPSRQHPEYWQDCTIPWFGLADVWQIRDGHMEYVRDTAEMISQLGLANSAARLLPAGTVILSRTASVGFSAIMAVDLATTQDFANWVCGATLRPEYLLYVFRSMGQEFDRLTMGSTHQTIYMPDIGTFSTSVPPIAEQDRIVAFIRYQAARIDSLVAEQERLIELLQEQRAALIASAVTKGVDPNVPMRDSGIEWLGQIPAHWDIAPVYSRYEVVLGKMLDTKRVTGQFSGHYLRNSDVQWGRVNTRDLPEMDFAPWERDRYLLRPGDLLVCEGGEVGRTAIWQGEIEECFYQKALHRLRPRVKREAPRFFYYLMSMGAACGIFSGFGNQNTIDHLTAVQLNHYRFPFAPFEEQDAIGEFLDGETARIDALVDKALMAATAAISSSETCWPSRVTRTSGLSFSSMLAALTFSANGGACTLQFRQADFVSGAALCCGRSLPQRRQLNCVIFCESSTDSELGGERRRDDPKQFAYRFSGIPPTA